MSGRTATDVGWHRGTSDDVLTALAAGGDGLRSAEAAARLARHGPNELPRRGRRTFVAVVLGQFTNVMALVLLGAASVSVLVGEVGDALVVAAILVVDAAIGATQELRSARALEALRRLAAPTARVRRDGAFREVPARELVPGDLLRVEAGDVVTADARLLEDAQLLVDEAPLTGESAPVDKRAKARCADDAAVGDRANLLHAGTRVVRGHGVAVVVATGLGTELGRIAELLQRVESVATPLQRRLDRFGRHVAVVVLAICALVFAAGMLRGEPTLRMLLTAVSLGVAAIPEALPAVVSVSLALGARRMARRNALVRRLPAVETLGSVTFVCADKTGTLTEGRMRLAAVLVDGERREGLPRAGEGDERWDVLGRAMAFAAARDAQGDPTEEALVDAAASAGHDRARLVAGSPLLHERSFDAERCRMSAVHADGEGAVVWVKGAPESVLQLCPAVDRPAIEAQVARLADEGLRVLAFARRRLATTEGAPWTGDVERELDFVGLAALADPPRDGAAAAVAACREAGITPVMITGDHPATARAVARALGLIDAAARDDEALLVGPELARLDDDELARRVRSVRVYARVSPEQKIRIVRALQRNGELVAMSGDGVNDAPALERAEIGVAMGRSGTEVAREASDMVLLDDDFGTIVAAVREGRRVFDDVRKFVKYTMTSNAGEIWTILIAPLFGLPLPLLPVQILWINLVTDGLPGLALAAEPEEADVMRRPPRRPDEGLFARGLGVHVVWVGLAIGAASIAAMQWAFVRGSPAWQTVVFTTLTFCQLAHVLVIRSERESLWTQGLTSNLPLCAAVLGTVALQLAVVYAEPLQQLFHTQPLSAAELLVCCLAPLAIAGAVELEKLVRRRRARLRRVPD